jgi:hypothetical protein
MAAAHLYALHASYSFSCFVLPSLLPLYSPLALLFCWLTTLFVLSVLASSAILLFAASSLSLFPPLLASFSALASSLFSLSSQSFLSPHSSDCSSLLHHSSLARSLPHVPFPCPTFYSFALLSSLPLLPVSNSFLLDPTIPLLRPRLCLVRALSLSLSLSVPTFLALSPFPFSPVGAVLHSPCPFPAAEVQADSNCQSWHSLQVYIIPPHSHPHSSLYALLSILNLTLHCWPRCRIHRAHAHSRKSRSSHTPNLPPSPFAELASKSSRP